MATIKNYTNIKQSKKLAEFLPLESADMRYAPFGDIHPWVWDKEVKLLEKGSIPCWSLAALLDIIPQELFDGEYIINITEGINCKWIISYEPYYEVSSYVNTSNNNLIDCCVEMIIKLKERKLL